MKLPLSLAKKLQQLKKENSVPASSFNEKFAEQLLSDGLLVKQSLGRTRYKLALKDSKQLDRYLLNRYGILDLDRYIQFYEDDEYSGADGVSVAGNSKIKKNRTFKGFLINSYEPITCMLNSKPFVCYPNDGSFLFVYDYDRFEVPPDVTVVGVENSENFRHILKQQYLFPHIRPLFVNRYPQSGDLVKWLMSIDNPYLHFGDFDFAGIHIFLTEFKKHLREKASFFIPPNVRELIRLHGNKDLYNAQMHMKNYITPGECPEILELIEDIEQERKGLEQQVLIISPAF